MLDFISRGHLHIKSFRPQQLLLFVKYSLELEQVNSTFQHVGDGSEGESRPSLKTEGDWEEQEAEGCRHGPGPLRCDGRALLWGGPCWSGGWWLVVGIAVAGCGWWTAPRGGSGTAGRCTGCKLRPAAPDLHFPPTQDKSP
jgi:hypothetical protein